MAACQLLHLRSTFTHCEWSRAADPDFKPEYYNLDDSDEDSCGEDPEGFQELLEMCGSEFHDDTNIDDVSDCQDEDGLRGEDQSSASEDGGNEDGDRNENEDENEADEANEGNKEVTAVISSPNASSGDPLGLYLTRGRPTPPGKLNGPARAHLRGRFPSRAEAESVVDLSNGLIRLAHWAFGPGGPPKLRVLAIGDFAHGLRHAQGRVFLCRDPQPWEATANRAETGRRFRHVSEEDHVLRDFIRNHMDFLAACPSEGLMAGDEY